MELKCKSCGGELQKSESVYICEKCGETYSASEINEAIKKAEALSENLLMKIEEVFNITGRGIVITGVVKSTIRPGDVVLINGLTYTISGIESYRKIVNIATAGTSVGLLLRNANIENLQVGYDVLSVNAGQNTTSPEAIARQLLLEGHPQLEAIKMLRERTGLGLAESKSIVDSVMATNNTVANTTSQQRQSGGCYIATCVYGSYNCPEVWTLRRFRDEGLSTKLFGKLFIKIYYAISPYLVKCFGESTWFRLFWKRLLDKFIKYLNGKGYSNSEYKDL